MNSMDSTKGKIGLKELVAIIILNVGTKVADNTPTIFMRLLEQLLGSAFLLLASYH